MRAALEGVVTAALEAAPDVSDILFSPGKRIQAEVHGSLVDVAVEPLVDRLTPFQTEALALAMMGSDLRLCKNLLEQGSADLSFELPGHARFRVNVFSRRGSLSIVMRKLSMHPPTIADLDLPEVFTEMAREKFGLILVTGTTGSGKSTSLAALVDAVNAERAVHIITLEDPVEFVHEHKRGVVNQRELGRDFDSFASGLRAALRQAPKVILVGEIRDRETLRISMRAAETGHLVLGTMHTSDAGRTISRIIGMFEPSEEGFVRRRLSESLKFVVSQRLMPKEGGGRVAAFEIMRDTLRVRDIIMNGEQGDNTLYSVIDTGDAHGMATFDRMLVKHFEQGLISEETAGAFSSDHALLRRLIDDVKKRRGESISDIGSLEIDSQYGEKGDEA